MRDTAFWSTLGRGAVLAAAAMATAGLAGCSNGSSRFDYPAYNLSSQGNGGGYDPATTASLGPVPPEPVYGGGYNSGNAYANATPPRTTPGFDSRGAYTGGNNYASNTRGNNSYQDGSNRYGNGGNSHASNSYSSGNSYSGGGSYNSDNSYNGGNAYKPTPVSYRPNDNANGYSGSSNSYPVQKAVYTPSAPKEPAMPPRRVASADRATLTGPGSKTITVQNGDSLYLYSLRYGVSVESIQKANNLDGIGLTAGQKVVIPAKGATVGDNSYIIQAGDSLNSIAKKHGVSEQALASANNITNARSLQTGQELKIPKGGSTPRPTVQARNDQARSAPQASKPETKQPESDNNVRVVRTQKIDSPDFSEKTPQKQEEPKQETAASSSGSSSQVASTKTLPNPAPMSGQRFRWPVNGRVISKFGSRADGGHNDGIDISVPQGTSVKAAENGVVAYAGDELKGYGNLVLIRHSNNWVSAYAHNEDLLVKRGDKVSRGQSIAKAGATGSVSQPQLHFELRKGSRPVDPLKYMSTATAGAN